MWCPSPPWPLVWITFIPVINMACITLNSMTTKDQASSGSQILGFYKARTQWSRIVRTEIPGSEGLSDTEPGSPVALSTHIPPVP